MKLPFLVLTTFALFCTYAPAETKPNFIIINIDDLGYGDIGPFGSTTPTPNLDRMAKEGRKLTSHYAAPVCSPSRAALMTGCYPKRVLPIPHVLFPAATVGLNPAERTIAEVLKDAGYATACVGKWHLGDQPEFLPTRQGFDSYYGIPYSNDMGTAADGSKSSVGKPLPLPPQEKSVTANPKKTAENEIGLLGAAQPPLPLFSNDKVVARVRAPEQLDITRQYTDHALTFIREHQEQPFFLYLPHTAVHFPLYPSREYQGKSPNGLLGDWVEEVDWSVGQILETLRSLKLAEKTLVIFTSDNGGSVPHGSINKPLRGTKGQTYEGGIRVPTIAWWPGKIPADSVTNAITSMMDILPTFAKLADAKVPNDRKIDGVDIWTTLAGKSDAKPARDHFFYYRGYSLEAVRSGPWKLHLALAEGAPGAKKSAPQLFQLVDDIGETKNVAADHPEIVQRLQALAQSMKDDLGLDGIGPGCRPLGRSEHPLPAMNQDGKVRPEFTGEQNSFP